MTIWLIVQYIYAAVAWSIAARAVARTAQFGGSIGRELAATVRELRATGRGNDVGRLGAALEPSPIAALLEIDVEQTSPFDLVATAERVSAEAAPPSRVLRTMATVGTMLGLLAAIATLRSALNASGVHAVELAATQAFDSAVVGFVTAVPCWTAVALCGRRARETYADLERIVLALGSDAKPASSGGSDDSAA